jgi:hypothetical protein
MGIEKNTRRNAPKKLVSDTEKTTRMFGGNVAELADSYSNDSKRFKHMLEDACDEELRRVFSDVTPENAGSLKPLNYAIHGLWKSGEVTGAALALPGGTFSDRIFAESVARIARANGHEVLRNGHASYDLMKTPQGGVGRPSYFEVKIATQSKDGSFQANVRPDQAKKGRTLVFATFPDARDLTSAQIFVVRFTDVLKAMEKESRVPGLCYTQGEHQHVLRIPQSVVSGTAVDPTFSKCKMSFAEFAEFAARGLV